MNSSWSDIISLLPLGLVSSDMDDEEDSDDDDERSDFSDDQDMFLQGSAQLDEMMISD